MASTGEGKPDRNPKMFELVDWLRQHVPTEDSSGAASGIVHGDFRIDNVVFHPYEVCRGFFFPRVLFCPFLFNLSKFESFPS